MLCLNISTVKRKYGLKRKERKEKAIFFSGRMGREIKSK